MEKSHIIIIGLVVFILICGAGILLMNTGPEDVLEINDINIVQDEFNIYNLEGHITPLKDFSYLEARIVFYDGNDTVVGKSYAWNSNNLKKGEKVSVGNGLGAVCDGVPDHAVVEFYDNVGSDRPIANATVTFTVNNTVNATQEDTSQASSSAPSTSQDSDNKYTEDDLKMAEANGYLDGYSDGYDDSNYYEDDEDYYYSVDEEGNLV